MLPVTKKMSDPRDALGQVLANVLLYGENGHLRNGLMAFGMKDITDFLLIELEEFKSLEYYENNKSPRMPMYSGSS
jgi:hypothetical protein